MRIPEGWEYVIDYCIKNGEYTICRIGGADGWRYELWRAKEQISVNLPTCADAILAYENGLSTKTDPLAA
jgi:hypothetical protein